MDYREKNFEGFPGRILGENSETKDSSGSNPFKESMGKKDVPPFAGFGAKTGGKKNLMKKRKIVKAREGYLMKGWRQLRF